MNKLKKIEQRVEEVEGRLNKLFTGGCHYLIERMFNELPGGSSTENLIYDYVNMEAVENLIDEFKEGLTEEEREEFEEKIEKNNDVLVVLKEDYEKGKKRYAGLWEECFYEDVRDTMIFNLQEYGYEEIEEDYDGNIDVFVKDENKEEWFNLIEELDDLKNDLSEEQKSKPQPTKTKTGDNMSKVKINEYYKKIKENGYDIEVRQDTNAHLNRVYLLKNKKRVTGDDGNYIYNKFFNNRNANISVDNMKHTYSNSHKEQALKELLEDIKEIKEKNEIKPKKKRKIKP